jgi:hypothetical protein
MDSNSSLSEFDDKSYRRFWILSLLSGVEEAGCSPINMGRFNILAYISNAVSQCYGVTPLNPTILKEKDGPLYPKLLWDLDRLVGVGFVRVSDVVVDNINKVRNVSYSITQQGLDYENCCRSLYPNLMEIGNSLRSAALAFARNYTKLSTKSLNSLDGNYANPIYSDGQVIDFGDWIKNNSTANSVELILKELQPTYDIDSSVGVNIYTAYLASFSGSQND